MIYLEKPAGFRPGFRAVGCFVECKGDILLLLRAKDRKIEPGKWGCPAGRVEKNETPEIAMLRELKEEAGIVIAGNQLLFHSLLYVDYPQCSFEYSLFRCCFPFELEISLSFEHVAHTWIPPAYASSLDLMEDELKCINMVYGH